MCKLSGLFTGPFIHFFFSLFFLPFFIKYACNKEKDTRPNLLFFHVSLSFRWNTKTCLEQLRWMSTVSLEMFYAFSVYVNILIMRRYAANKLMKKNSVLSSWYICPEVVCRNFFCFRRLWHIACTAMWELLFFYFIFIGNGCKLLIKIWRNLAEILFILAWKKYPLIPIATNVCDDKEMSHVFSRRKRCCWHCNIWPDWFTSRQSHIIVYITMAYRSLWENVRY